MIMAVFYFVSALFVVTSVVFIMKNVKKVKKTHISKERLKRQLELTTSYLEDVVFELPAPALANGYKTLYIMESIINMVAKWVVTYEVTTDEYNVSNKGLLIYNFVLSMTHSESYKDEKFKDFCIIHIKELFKKLEKV